MPTSSKKSWKNATFRVPTDVWRRAKKQAVEADRSLNDVVIEALERFSGGPAARVEAMRRFVASAERIAARQPKGPRSRPFTKDELHEDEV